MRCTVCRVRTRKYSTNKQLRWVNITNQPPKKKNLFHSTPPSFTDRVCVCVCGSFQFLCIHANTRPAIIPHFPPWRDTPRAVRLLCDPPRFLGNEYHPNNRTGEKQRDGSGIVESARVGGSGENSISNGEKQKKKKHTLEHF